MGGRGFLFSSSIVSEDATGLSFEGVGGPDEVLQYMLLTLSTAVLLMCNGK